MADFGLYEEIGMKNICELSLTEEYLLYGNLNRNLGNYSKALKYLIEGNRKYPRKSLILYNLALCFFQLGEYKYPLFYALKSYNFNGYLYSLDLILKILTKLNQGVIGGI